LIKKREIFNVLTSRVQKVVRTAQLTVQYGHSQLFTPRKMRHKVRISRVCIRSRLFPSFFHSLSLSLSLSLVCGEDVVKIAP